MSFSKPVLSLGSKGYVGVVNQDNSKKILHQYFGDHSVSIEDSYLNLTNDIEYLLTHDEERKNIGTWCRAWCLSNFDEIDMGKKISEIYFHL